MPARLPACFAEAVSDWAVGALESLSGLASPAAAKALLQLALRGKAVAAESFAGDAGMAAGSVAEDGGAADLGLLHALAADVKGMLEPGEANIHWPEFVLHAAATLMMVAICLQCLSYTAAVPLVYCHACGMVVKPNSVLLGTAPPC